MNKLKELEKKLSETKNEIIKELLEEQIKIEKEKNKVKEKIKKGQLNLNLFEFSLLDDRQKELLEHIEKKEKGLKFIDIILENKQELINKFENKKISKHFTNFLEKKTDFRCFFEKKEYGVIYRSYLRIYDNNINYSNDKEFFYIYMNDFNINNFKTSLFFNELEKEKNHYKKSLTELKNEFLNYYNILEKKEATKEKIKELLKEFNTYYKKAIINEL